MPPLTVLSKVIILVQQNHVSIGSKSLLPYADKFILRHVVKSVQLSHALDFR